MLVVTQTELVLTGKFVLIPEEMLRAEMCSTHTCLWVCTLFLLLPQRLALGQGERKERGLWPRQS